MTKAEKQRNYEIEVANEALLKKMMKIVNVSLIYNCLTFNLSYRERTSSLRSRLLIAGVRKSDYILQLQRLGPILKR